MDIRQISSNDQLPLDLLLSADPSERIVRSYLQRGECYIGEIDNQVVGVYVLLPTRPKTIEIVNIAVVDFFQNKGFGKQLISHAIDQSIKKKYTHIEIGTGNSSVNQLALYQKLGFRITSIDFDFFKEHYEEEIIENGIVCRDMIRLSKRLVP